MAHIVNSQLSICVPVLLPAKRAFKKKKKRHEKLWQWLGIYINTANNMENQSLTYLLLLLQLSAIYSQINNPVFSPITACWPVYAQKAKRNAAIAMSKTAVTSHTTLHTLFSSRLRCCRLSAAALLRVTWLAADLLTAPSIPHIHRATRLYHGLCEKESSLTVSAALFSTAKWQMYNKYHPSSLLWVL